MITMPVLQFVFLLGVIIVFMVWFMTKMFVLACVHNETSLKHVLLQVWQKNPNTLQGAMHWLLTQEEADTMIRTIVDKNKASNRLQLDNILHDANFRDGGPLDFTNGNCRHCGQPVPWSARSSEIPPP